MATIEKIIMRKGNEVWKIPSDTTVYDAIKMMSEKKVGALPVVDNHKLVGIISERDYTRKIILEGRTSKETRVKDIMTEKVFYTTPTQKIEECMAVMTEHHVRHLPVMKDGQLEGMISIGDVVKYIISDQKFKIEQLENSISWGESY